MRVKDHKEQLYRVKAQTEASEGNGEGRGSQGAAVQGKGPDRRLARGTVRVKDHREQLYRIKAKREKASEGNGESKGSQGAAVQGKGP